jgi:hypothetical protein
MSFCPLCLRVRWPGGLAAAMAAANVFAMAPALAAAALPDAAAIQSAYEAAYIATRGKPPGTHADDLVIQTAQCRPLGGGAACQIDFVRRREPEGRLYFDIVTLEPEAGGMWALRSGLCMSKPAAARHAARTEGVAP